MSIKHAVNKETNEEYKVLIHVTRFNEKQMSMITRIIAFYDAIDENMKALAARFNVKSVSDEDKKRYAQRLYRRVEIYHASVLVDKDRHCAVYYVTKNKALQRADHLYDLKRCKSLTSASESKTNEASETKQVTKRENKRKRESATDRAIDAQNAKREQAQLSESESNKALALLSESTNEANTNEASESNTNEVNA